MFSRIVAVIFAVNFIFLGSGQEMNLLLGDLQPVLKCYKAGEDAALAYMEALGESPDTDADKIKATCLSLREFGLCLVNVIEAKKPPIPKMFHFYAAMQYQHNVLLKKAGLCPEIPYDKLKKITLESGILKEEKLVNIEDDDYAKCAGDGLKKCIIKSVIMFEHRVDMLTEDLKYIECMEEEAKTCSAPIMQHFKAQLEAYKKHLNELLKLKQKLSV